MDPSKRTLEKFENGVFTLWSNQTFSIHTALEKFKNAVITGDYGFVFEKNSGREITIVATPSFLNRYVSKCFSSYENENEKPVAFKVSSSDGRPNRQSCVFKFLRFRARVDGA